MRIFWLAIAALSLPITCQAQEVPRLQRPAEATTPDGKLNGDATIGQVVVGAYFIFSKQLRALELMSDDFVCKQSTPMLLASAAKDRARAMDLERRAALKKGDPAAREWLAIEALAELEGIDAQRIRADEAIGPGVYRPAIDAIAYTIGRCRFY